MTQRGAKLPDQGNDESENDERDKPEWGNSSPARQSLNPYGPLSVPPGGRVQGNINSHIFQTELERVKRHMDYPKENLIGKEFRSIKYENGSIMIVLDRGSIAVNTKISCSIVAYMQSINIIDVVTDSGLISLIFSDGSEIRISRVIERGISPESFVYHGEDNIIIVDNSISG